MKSFMQYLHELKMNLEYHSELNSKLWDDDHLKPAVREKLLAFIDEWRKYAKIPENLVQDIIMTGGNANYNYTPLSDIDVHLIVDRNKLGPDRELVDDFLQSKKMLWTLSHSGVKIMGYSVEPYAQDPSETFHAGQGAYSLQHDKWIQHPEHGNYNFAKDKNLRNKVKFYADAIDELISSGADKETFDILKNKISTMRGAAILQGGEFSQENLVFKVLRNAGYLDKMTKYRRDLEDKSLSL